MGTKRKKKTPKGRNYGLAKIKQILTTAIFLRETEGPNAFKRAAKQHGISATTVFTWKNKYPELIKQIEAELAPVIKKTEDDLVKILQENATLAAKQINTKLNDEDNELSAFELNGILQTAIHNARLIQDKSTENTNMTFNMIIGDRKD